MINNKKKAYLGYLLIALIMASLPFLANMGLIRNALVLIFGTTMIYAIVALGLNILLGYGGMISLGTAGFMGLAAYMSAYFTENLALSFGLSFALAIAIPTLIGLLVGLLSLKMSGIYLAIATLAISEVFREIFVQLDHFTGGASGKMASYPLLFGRFRLDQDGMYLFIVVCMLIVFILMHNLTSGYLGRSLNALRSSQPAAQAMGVNSFKTRIMAFGISTALAALGGVLYVHFIKISLPTTWTLNLSLTFLAIIVVGGFRSISGTLLGSVIIYALTEIFFKPIPALANWTPVLQGLLMILFVMFYPQGTIHIFQQIKSKLKIGKSKIGYPEVGVDIGPDVSEIRQEEERND